MRTRVRAAWTSPGILLAVSLAAAPLAAQGPSMPAPSGRVTYQITSTFMSGTSTVTWTDGGKRFRNEMSTTLAMGQPGMRVTNWTIWDGQHIYIHTPMTGKQVYRIKPQGKDAPNPSAMSGLAALGEGAKKAKKVGTGTHLGKPCEIREANGFKVWTWKNLMLRTEASSSAPQPRPGAAGAPAAQPGMQFSMSMKATKLELNVKPAESLFKVPPGYEVKDGPPQFGGGSAGPGGAAAGGPPQIPTRKAR